MVVLQDLIESIGSDASEGRWFIDLQTHELVMAPHSALDLMVSRKLTERDLEGAPEGVRTAYKIVNSPPERFLELPGQLDVIEWTIMRKFAASMNDLDVREKLTTAIGDVNAFRDFAQLVRRLRLGGDWEAFRQIELRSIAIEWCEAHDVSYT